MDNLIVAAFVGIVSAITVVFLKDFIFPRYFIKEQKKEKIKSLNERYAHPLASSSLGLFYRLREIVVSKRFDYLQSNNQKNTFNRYKYVSTLFRLASLIGWIRALKLEQSYLLQPRSSSDPGLSKVIYDFETALADGPHAEHDALIALSSLWLIELPCDGVEKERIAMRIDTIRNCMIGDIEVKECEVLVGLSDEEKINLLVSIAESICSHVNVQAVDIRIIEETREKAIKILSPRQSWIYRDWQSAIGDIMIKEVDKSVRRFDLIGYSEFEKYYNSKNRWIGELQKVFDDVDLDVIDKFDYRVQQIISLLNASARIIDEIGKLGFDSMPISRKNISDVEDYFKNNAS